MRNWRHGPLTLKSDIGCGIQENVRSSKSFCWLMRQLHDAGYLLISHKGFGLPIL